MGLDRPVGITVEATNGNTKVILHQGDPEPTYIVVSRNGSLYWTWRREAQLVAILSRRA
jgi:hypothetical protein